MKEIGEKSRCFGSMPKHEMLAQYHDNEWGIPVYNDNKLFEMLVLEGAQAGLSWETVLKKRQGYRDAFYNFDPAKVVAMSDEELVAQCTNKNIIRNKRKIYSVRNNAEVLLDIQKEHGSFCHYLWGFVKHTPIVNAWKNHSEIPAYTEKSQEISESLQKKGMSFVGPTIIYAYMQAVGLVNDHLVGCWRYEKK